MRSVINEAKFTKRFNLGEFNFEEFSLGAVVDEKESGAEVLVEMKKQINEAFTGELTEETAEEPTKKPKEKKDAKPTKADNAASGNAGPKSKSKKDESNDDDGGEDDETPNPQNDEDDNDSPDESDVDDSGENDAEEKPTKGKGKKEPGEKSGKKFKQKTQTYNRSIEQHKEIFSGVLRSVASDWKKTDAGKALAKSASAKMEGENFLDENGEVIAEFKTATAKLMKAKK